MNGLLHYAPALAELPRAGIMHRLDKDTTGVLVVARTLVAHTRWCEALARRADIAVTTVAVCRRAC